MCKLLMHLIKGCMGVKRAPGCSAPGAAWWRTRAGPCAYHPLLDHKRSEQSRTWPASAGLPAPVGARSARRPEPHDPDPDALELQSHAPLLLKTRSERSRTWPTRRARAAVLASTILPVPVGARTTTLAPSRNFPKSLSYTPRDPEVLSLGCWRPQNFGAEPSPASNGERSRLCDRGLARIGDRRARTQPLTHRLETLKPLPYIPRP